jgi:hypothetical protein
MLASAHHTLDREAVSVRYLKGLNGLLPIEPIKKYERIVTNISALILLRMNERVIAHFRHLQVI